MPFDRSTLKIAEAYLQKSVHPINESVKSEEVKQHYKDSYYSNTPFHRFMTEYGSIYNGYVLHEQYTGDVANLGKILKDEQLCLELFGGVGQKISQAVLKPLVKLILSKLPQNVKQQLAGVAKQGDQALQAYLQQNGDQNVTNQLAAQPVQEARIEQLQLLETLLYLRSLSPIINEDAKQNKFKQFKKYFGELINTIQDPNIRSQAEQIRSYIDQNYSTRGAFKGGAVQQTNNTTPNQQQTPNWIYGQRPQQPAPAQQPTGVIPVQGQGVLPAQTPQQPGMRTVTGSHRTINQLPAPQTGGFFSKVTNFIRNNPKLTTAGLLAVLAAVGIGTGGFGLAPIISGVLSELGSVGDMSSEALPMPETQPEVPISDVPQSELPQAPQVEEPGTTAKPPAGKPLPGAPEGKGAPDLVRKSIEAQNTMAQKGLKPDEEFYKDSLGRLFKRKIK